MSGAIADGEVVSEGPPNIGAWGDGLVDRSLASLWYPTDWDDVSDDELAFLLPTLDTWRPGSTDGRVHGPVGRLTQALKARTLSATALIAARSDATPRQALEMLVSQGLLTMVPLHDFASAAAGPPPVGPGIEAARGRKGAALPDWLVIELTALAHLDRLVWDAKGAPVNAGRAPLVDWPLSLADLVIATVNARLNGAYVHPRFAHAHELLTAAALLGHLVHGRTVYMPPHLAQCLVDQLCADGSEQGGTRQGCADILKVYAALAGGLQRTLSLLRRAAASGRPYLAKPRRPVMPSDIGRTTWNARLLERIARHCHLWA